MTQELGFKGWLASRGITQTEIAELLDLSLQSVNMKVNGKKEFTLPQVKKICQHYGISADVFLPSELQDCNNS